jgi:putative phosphoribosyl transferase
VFTQPVEFRCGSAVLQADLTSSEDSRAVVVFAHGTGSSRFSPRNRAVAARLQREGLATLLLDLLTSEEEAMDRQSGQFRFDVHLLGERLVSAAEWLAGWVASGLPSDVALGYFGASTGAAAAVLAACRQGHRVGAIVSRGGRPDLAQDALRMLVSPTLLIVGGHDEVVLELNRQAAGKISCEHELMVVPGASHLFEEPGALDQVAELAAGWFSKYLLRPALG